MKRIETLKDSFTRDFEDRLGSVDPTTGCYEETLDQTNRAKTFLHDYHNSEALRVSETSPAREEVERASDTPPVNGQPTQAGVGGSGYLPSAAS